MSIYLILSLTVVFIVIIIIAMRPQRRTNVGPENVTVYLSADGGKASVAASLSYKGWFAFSFSFTGGTIIRKNLAATAVFTVQPVSNPTTLAAPDCYFTIQGNGVGTGTFSIYGSSIHGNHPVKNIAVTVLP